MIKEIISSILFQESKEIGEEYLEKARFRNRNRTFKETQTLFGTDNLQVQSQEDSIEAPRL